MKQKLTVLFSFVLIVNMGFCQSQNTDTTNNLNTIDGIVHALYDDISGPVGQERNWSGFSNLFAENARMYIAVTNNNSAPVLKSLTPEEYVQRNQTRLSDIGFSEDELYRVTNSYGAGSQVFSTYESHYNNKSGEEEITKGINNIQLFFDGNRHYIVSIFWDANAKNVEVPDRYLPKDKHTEYQINLN